MSSVKDYEVLDTVGSGAFGECQKIRRKSDGKILAWKVVSYQKMKAHQQERLISEVNLLMELNHPNIIEYYDHFVDQEDKKVYIVTEYCEFGDLCNLINHCIKNGCFPSEDSVLRVVMQLVSALKHCHRRPDGRVVLHHDLKPNNVFIDQNLNIKLGDFGLAAILPSKNDFLKSAAGTPMYMCPQKLTRTAHNEKSDIWSLGCLIYELCALRPPFTDDGGKCLFSSICSGEFSRIPSCYSDKLVSLIGRMLQVSDYMRPSVIGILNSTLLADMVADEKETSPRPARPLPPPMSVADLRAGNQEPQPATTQKRRLEPEPSLSCKRRRESSPRTGVVKTSSSRTPTAEPRTSANTCWVFWPGMNWMWCLAEKLVQQIFSAMYPQRYPVEGD